MDNFANKQNKSKLLINSLTNHSSVFEYLSKIQSLDTKSAGWMFFKTGWYLDRSIMSSLCSNFSLAKWNETSETSLQPAIALKIWYMNWKYYLTFMVRNRNEARYLKFLCKLNDRVMNVTNKLDNRMKLDKFFRLFYVLKDTGGKSAYDTDRVFSISTHFATSTFSVKNYSSSKKEIYVHRFFRKFTVDYGEGHLQHFRRNVENVIKDINPIDIRFNIFYFNQVDSN